MNYVSIKLLKSYYKPTTCGKKVEQKEAPKWKI